MGLLHNYFSHCRSPQVFDRLRAKLQSLLCLLRLRTCGVCQALRSWRVAKRQLMPESTLPDDEIIYVNGGANYLLSLAFDCRLLPFPWEQAQPHAQTPLTLHI